MTSPPRSSGPCSTRCPPSTRTRSTTCSSGAVCRAASRASTWPASSPSPSATTTCRERRSPAIAHPRCRPLGWRCMRSGPARAMCSSRPASRPCLGSPMGTPTAGRARTTRYSPRRRSDRSRPPKVALTWHDPRGGRPASEHLPARWARPPRTWLSSRASPARTWTTSACGRRTSPNRRSRPASGLERSRR